MPKAAASATSVEPWLAALHETSARLDALTRDLSEAALARPSFAANWTIAQVLSHLGSAADISARLVKRGLAGGTETLGRAELERIWGRWNALGPVQQRAEWTAADVRHLALLDALDAEQRAALRVPYFAGPLDLTAYAGYRLSEQSVHAWDIEVALAPGAVIPAPEVALLWDRLDVVATRFRDGATLSRLAPANILVSRTDDRHAAALLLTCELHLYPCEPAEPAIATVTGTTEALVRLVYGRDRPGVDEVTVAGAMTLGDLRALFPGY